MARKRQRPRGAGTLFKKGGRGPWVASWFDHTGKRRERSTRTSDRAAAERILSKHVADAALRRDGVIDANKDRYAIEGRKPLSAHVQDYLEHCRHVGQAQKHVAEKVRHLDHCIQGTGASRLADLTADTLERFLHALKTVGKSARTINFCRQVVVAFMSWCCKTGRTEANPLLIVPKLDESKDRRRVRRPISDEELGRLLEVAEQNGRRAWYLTAALAGLRRGDLQRLTWADVDFDRSALTIRNGKSNREDSLPMHPQLATELRHLFDYTHGKPMERVFPHAVTARTVLKDFLRAGLAREEVVLDEDGDPVMIGKGKRRRPKTRIVTHDAEGRVIDLHALRTTLGTNLARAGVAPQVAQRVMRHADYRTTLKHYTVLGLTDTANAIRQLPPIRADQQLEAKVTGTDHASPGNEPQLKPQQLERETARTRATPRETDERLKRVRTNRASPCQQETRATLSDVMRRGARKRATRLELATSSLEGWCSTIELHPRGGPLIVPEPRY
jgi:integrase